MVNGSLRKKKISSMEGIRDGIVLRTFHLMVWAMNGKMNGARHMTIQSGRRTKTLSIHHDNVNKAGTMLFLDFFSDIE
jgi:hypothetical protein